MNFRHLLGCDIIGHTDREEDWFQGFQSLMEYKNDYHRLMLLFDKGCILF